jgi:hypothetical protein
MLHRVAALNDAAVVCLQELDLPWCSSLRTTQRTPHSRISERDQTLYLVNRSRGSSVSIVSDYGLDDRAIEVRSQAEAKGFFL